ncbi:MAG: DUF2723 domain-containing protein [Candidatus Firestonebacteria bacterium]
MIRPTTIFAFIVIFTSFLFYLFTISPTVVVGDSGELITAVHSLGIAHPPGYPVFCILGKIFTFLPVGTIAFRVNLMSAFFSSISLLFIYLILLKIWGHSKVVVADLSVKNESNVNPVFLSASMALCFAFTNTFWSQALMSEVYALNTFFLSVLIYILVLWYEKLQNQISDNKLLYLFSFIYGVSLANHNTMVLFGPIAYGWIILCTPDILKKKNVLILLLALIFLGLTTYFYMPIRALTSPAINWGNPDTLTRFIDQITRRQYGDLAKDPRALALFGRQILEYLKLLIKQISPFLTIFSVIGIWYFYKINRKYFVLTLALFLGLSLGFILLLNFQLTTETILSVAEFFTASYVIAIIWLCFGFKFILERLYPKKQLFYMTYGIIFLIPILSLKLNYFENDLSRKYIAYDYNISVMKSMPKNSMLLGMGDNIIFPLSYLQKVEKNRQDLKIYDDIGCVFENIYGEDFLKFPEDYKKQKRTEIQKLLIKNSQNPVYCVLGSNLSNITGISLTPEGLVCKTLPKNTINSDKDDIVNMDFQSGKGKLIAIPVNQSVNRKKNVDTKFDWSKIYIRGIDDDTVYKDYLNRDLIAQYHFFYAEHLFFKNDIKNAKEEYNKSFKVAQDIEWIKNNIMVTLNVRGLSDEVEKIATESVKIDSNNAQIYVNLGISFYNKGVLDKAIESYKKAIEIDSKCVEAHSNLGVVYEKMGLTNDAINEYKITIELESNHIIARHNLGVLYKKEGKYIEAINEFEKVIKINPDLTEAYISLGISYGKLNQYENAIKVFKKIIEKDDSNAEAHYNLGVAYYKIGVLKDAKQEWEKTLSINPNYPLVKEHLAHIFGNTKN